MQLVTLEGEAFEIYVAGSEKATKGVLIIHDWWGVADYNRDWAAQFAKAGYRAMVIDLYNGYHPTSTKEAGEYARQLDQEVMQRKLHTALLALHSPRRKVATLGWSFGGVQAQQTALRHPHLVSAIVLYYCRIVLDKQKVSALQCPVLAVFAETELTWPDKQAAIEHIMYEADKTLECHSYDADHGFVDPNSLHYDSDATEQAWKATLAFLNKHLA